MITRNRFFRYTRATAVLLGLLHGADISFGQQRRTINAGTIAPPGVPVTVEPVVSSEAAASSVEQGHAPLSESFDWDMREWRLERRRNALEDTQFKFNLRAMYIDRNKYDGTESEALAIGGWAGLKTGYFLDHIALGVTGYTSQHLYGDDDKDGTSLLEPGQEGYSVLGEIYADIRIVDGLNLYAGRKEYETPFINGDDTRMTPKTFEAYTLMGQAKIGEGGATLKYGLGYFHRIKEWNSVDFVPMSEDAGAMVDRGVFTAGALYQKGNFSIGAIDYYSADIINIGYFEARQELPLGNGWKPRLAVQFTDQRSVGDNLLQGGNSSAQQYGVKAELPFGQALFTVGYTGTSGDTNMQSPWGAYPGYTSVQVEDFNRDGEGAFIVRAGYDVKQVKGLSAYALWVHGSDPDRADEYARNEYDLSLQWAPPEGVLKGFSLRLRYAFIQQDGGNVDDLEDLRVICNYAIKF